ncbi:4'-phosphopantetheinyl transferase family protein [Spirosoma pollinicola]|uniref:Uncharacterized protein n=1 Tax=Spirosoma pollinicola TaxID=2057025 RepID=A0A2K8Z1Z5_9BACT|nr:4'-phosphopantetheinyl transferase superfamily protein [Spirosoma pollinicola]AUD03906.1 hypothetical protein CWM47_20010 [Spirosoma pollinicola]
MSVHHVACSDFKDISWLSLPDCSYKDDIAVFRFDLVEGAFVSPYLTSLLQPDEINRAERYHRSEDRKRFIHSRGILRILAGNYTAQAPDQIRFIKGPNKKPALAGDTGWHINVSHSGGWALFAIGQVSVGVDVEKINPGFSFQEILPASFSPEEQAYINGETDAYQRFYQLWTRKEAFVKATGKGMDEDFFRIPSLTGLHAAESRLLGGSGNWNVGSFEVASGYSAAVAYQELPEIPKFYALNSVLFNR